MSILVLLVALLTCGALIFLKRFTWALGALGFAVGLILFIGSGRAQRWVLPAPLQVLPLKNPEWKARNLIVILGGGVTKWADGENLSTPTLSHPRLHEGLRLYLLCKKAGKVCRVLLTGGNSQGPGSSEAEVMARELGGLGLDGKDVVLEKASANTYQNARFCAPLVEKEKADAVYLVTAGLHLRRAMLLFQSFGMNPIPVAADYVPSKLSNSPQAFNFLLFDLTVHELMGILQFHFYEKMGWNVR